ncbi:hypothetical protein V6N11_077601 [Hibiscus sabdariffa]|uniref:Transmembrane protein n=1 Tax=Hibiscus sabdariffa TaxID=183260 RepID=A0ABR2TDI9_9ROSI
MKNRWGEKREERGEFGESKRGKDYEKDSVCGMGLFRPVYGVLPTTASALAIHTLVCFWYFIFVSSEPQRQLSELVGR